MCPRQQIANRAIVPIPASGGADASIIQSLSNGAMGRRTRSLYLADDGQHVGSERIRCLSVCRHALCLRNPKIGEVSQNGALRLLLRQCSPTERCRLSIKRCSCVILVLELVSPMFGGIRIYSEYQIRLRCNLLPVSQVFHSRQNDVARDKQTPIRDD